MRVVCSHHALSADSNDVAQSSTSYFSSLRFTVKGREDADKKIMHISYLTHISFTEVLNLLCSGLFSFFKFYPRSNLLSHPRIGHSEDLQEKGCCNQNFVEDRD